MKYLAFSIFIMMAIAEDCTTMYHFTVFFNAAITILAVTTTALSFSVVLLLIDIILKVALNIALMLSLAVL